MLSLHTVGQQIAPTLTTSKTTLSPFNISISPTIQILRDRNKPTRTRRKEHCTVLDLRVVILQAL